MKLVLILVIACIAVTSSIQTSSESDLLKFEPQQDIPFEQHWSNFKLKHGKVYSTVKDEEERREIFRINLKKILVHNYLYQRGDVSFSMGVNEYSDLEHSEFVRQMNGLRPRNITKESDGATYLSPNVPVNIPVTIDWRPSGYVTEVKDQGQCGSCWAFSATGSLEGQWFKKTKKLPDLSEQNLVDCSKKWGNDGCNGGMMENAFTYIKDNRGIDTEQSYPYEAKDGRCRFMRAHVGAMDTGFVDLPHNNEMKLQEAVATIGPISIAIDASHESFQHYQQDVYDEPKCSSQNLDHGVLIVGYGTYNGKDYWMVKNSWGTSWGLKGYIMMSRNKRNQCGVATQASYPLV